MIDDYERSRQWLGGFLVGVAQAVNLYFYLRLTGGVFDVVLNSITLVMILVGGWIGGIYSLVWWREFLSHFQRGRGRLP